MVNEEEFKTPSRTETYTVLQYPECRIRELLGYVLFLKGIKKEHGPVKSYMLSTISAFEKTKYTAFRHFIIDGEIVSKADIFAAVVVRKLNEEELCSPKENFLRIRNSKTFSEKEEDRVKIMLNQNFSNVEKILVYIDIKRK